MVGREILGFGSNPYFLGRVRNPECLRLRDSEKKPGLTTPAWLLVACQCRKYFNARVVLGVIEWRAPQHAMHPDHSLCVC